MITFGRRHLPEEAERFGQRIGVIEQRAKPRSEVRRVQVVRPLLRGGVTDLGKDDAGVVHAAMCADESGEGWRDMSVAFVGKINGDHWELVRPSPKRPIEVPRLVKMTILGRLTPSRD